MIEIKRQIDTAMLEKRYVSRVRLKIGTLSAMCHITRTRYDPDVSHIDKLDRFFEEDPDAAEALSTRELERYRCLLTEARRYLYSIYEMTELQRESCRSHPIPYESVMVPQKKAFDKGIGLASGTEY